MKLIYGRVMDKYTVIGIDSVRIYSKDSLFSTTSVVHGTYNLMIPGKERKLYFVHKDYYREKVRLKEKTRILDVRLKPLVQLEERFGEPAGKNAVAWLPSKHILGALGLRYDRILGQRLSAGIYVDWYYRGRQFLGSDKYTGIKVTPTGRYYFIHHEYSGFYLQLSAMAGYFDFSELNYEYVSNSGDEVSVTYNFWTGGAGAAIGSYFVLGKSELIYLDINLGTQFMPAKWPDDIEANGKTYSSNKNWWYFSGPASFFEIKIAVGLIFDRIFRRFDDRFESIEPEEE